MTRAQIVERFTLSPHTVRTHIGHVLTKLEVHNTLSAVSIARKAGLAARRPDAVEQSLPRVRAADTVDGPHTSGVGNFITLPDPRRVAVPRLQEGRGWH